GAGLAPVGERVGAGVDDAHEHGLGEVELAPAHDQGRWPAHAPHRNGAPGPSSERERVVVVRAPVPAAPEPAAPEPARARVVRTPAWSAPVRRAPARSAPGWSAPAAGRAGR